MAGRAVQGKIDNLGMAVCTARQGCSVTKGAGLLDISGRIVIAIVPWSGPGGGMGIIGGMARFTSCAADTVNSDIESRIASCTAGWIVGVTGLAKFQVLLGHRSMIVLVKETAVEFMRHWSGCMTGTAVKGR
jgi:hypothetical protein